eukprot:SAG11_NODE_1530_length_4737_cov_3.232643_6_plen_226_part_00
MMVAMVRTILLAAASVAVPSASSSLGNTTRACCVSLDNSLLRELTPDPQTAQFAPNKNNRDVWNGHYVRVRPTPLRNPYLVAHSADFAQLLGLTTAQRPSTSEGVPAEGEGVGRCSCNSSSSAVQMPAFGTPEFDRLFSGGSVLGWDESWAAPYALSIFGQVVVPGNSGTNGAAYGDGRAISLGLSLSRLSLVSPACLARLSRLVRTNARPWMWPLVVKTVATTV